MRVNNDCRRDILERLRADGPLPTSELPDTCVVPWKSSGWNDNRNVRMMLDKLVQRGRSPPQGELAATGSGTSPPGSIPTIPSLHSVRPAGGSTRAA